jgi:hypothetical protein
MPKTDKVFPNGFSAWQETHFEVVSKLSWQLQQDEFDSKLVADRYVASGIGGMYELAEELTDEFENLFQGREWDGDFFEALDDFLTAKLYMLSQIKKMPYKTTASRKIIYETILKEVKLPIYRTSKPYICHKLLVAMNGRTWFDKQSYVEIDKAMLAFPEFAQVFESWGQSNLTTHGYMAYVATDKARAMLLKKAIKLCM